MVDDADDVIAWLVTRSCLIHVSVGPVAFRLMVMGIILATEENIRYQ